MSYLQNLQKKFIYNHSSEFKNEVILNSIENLNNYINIEYKLLDFNNKLLKDFDFFYYYLNSKLYKTIPGSPNIYGYNQNTIQSEQVIDKRLFLKYSDIYTNINTIYSSFDSIVDFDMFKIFINNFELDINDQTNYIKTVFDFDLHEFPDLPERVSFLTTFPLYSLSQDISNDLIVNLFADFNIIKYLEPEITNTKLSDYIIKNVCKEFNMSPQYYNNIGAIINNDFINTKFAEYVSTLNNYNELLTLNEFVCNNINESFVYLFYTELQPFINIEISDKYKTLVAQITRFEANNINQELAYILKLFNGDTDLDPLKYINSILMAFSLWIDNFVNSKVNDNILTNSQIADIIKHVRITDDVGLKAYLETNFIPWVRNSKVIDNAVNQYYNKVVMDFINIYRTDIINNVILDLNKYFKNKFFNLYTEFNEVENINSIMDFIHFSLFEDLAYHNNFDLKVEYINIVENNPFNFSLDIKRKLENLYSINDDKIDMYKHKFTSFIISMTYNYALDKYLDKFRLIKKF